MNDRPSEDRRNGLPVMDCGGSSDGSHWFKTKQPLSAYAVTSPIPISEMVFCCERARQEHEVAHGL